MILKLFLKKNHWIFLWKSKICWLNSIFCFNSHRISSKILDFSQKLKQKTQGFDKLKNAVWRKQVEFLSLVYVLVVVGPPGDHWLLMEASSFFCDLRLPPMTTTSLWPPSCPISCPCSVSFAHLKRSRHLIRTDLSEEGEIFVTVWPVEVKIFPLSSFHSPSSCASFLHARNPRRNQSYSIGRVT